jgi:diguanylate cyclase (GGDEF)-like protein
MEGFLMFTLFKQHRMRNQTLAATLGFLLGLGAPLGWLLFQFFTSQHDLLIDWFSYEINQSGLIYLYMTVGTAGVFTLFGYFLGRQSDKVSEESVQVKGTLKEFSNMAMTDALTNIANARFLHESLSMVIEAARRYETPLTCLMIDIDDFKNINDRYGHPHGDVVLINIAKILKQSVRRIDVVGRLGGEEFLALMPHTSPDVAFTIAERIRQSVQRWPFVIENTPIPVTVSIGVACFPSVDVLDKKSLLKSVDAALYQAKHLGKNQTFMAQTNSMKTK